MVKLLWGSSYCPYPRESGPGDRLMAGLLAGRLLLCVQEKLSLAAVPWNGFRGGDVAPATAGGPSPKATEELTQLPRDDGVHRGPLLARVSARRKTAYRLLRCSSFLLKV